MQYGISTIAKMDYVWEGTLILSEILTIVTCGAQRDLFVSAYFADGTLLVWIYGNEV